MVNKEKKIKRQLRYRQKIDFIVDEPSFPLIPLDQDLIWQVLQNLISNAIRYSHEKSSITVRISKTPAAIQWTIADQGIGVPKNQKWRMFEKFFRAENAANMVPEGTGLGLPLAKTLVEGWGGSIWFESDENKGTTFYVTLPLTGMRKQEGDKTLGAHQI